MSAAAACALGMTGAAHGQTLSWSQAGATISNCFVSNCANTTSLDAHAQSGGANTNASVFVQSPNRGDVAAWATPGDSGLLPDLHAIAVTFPAGSGDINLGFAAVQAVQVFKWTGAAFDIDPSDFVGSLDYSASIVPDAASGVIAGFAILDASVIADHSLADPFYDFGTSGNALVDAFRGDCSSPGAVAIADGGYDHAKGSQSYTLGATACHGVLHVNTGDQFVLWAKMFINEYAPGTFDASHTFHIGLDPDLDPQTVQTLASSVEVQSFDYAVPEPAAWVLMILGLGGAGAGLRRHRRFAAA